MLRNGHVRFGRRPAETHPGKPGQGAAGRPHTKLPGPVRGRYYDLYVMIDIFSRYVVHWEIHLRESGELAGAFIENAFCANGGIAPDYIHSDRGSAMTSITVTELLSDLGIVKSHSRPKTSNDNPYSEAQFKTLKYCPVFPEKFGSVHDARSFCRRFFEFYNHEHYHSGVGLHTPFTVHIGTAHAIQDKRAETIEVFRAANPQRFTRRPSLPEVPGVVWINQPDGQEQHQPEEALA